MSRQSKLSGMDESPAADVVEFFRVVEEGRLQDLKKLIEERKMSVDIANQVHVQGAVTPICTIVTAASAVKMLTDDFRQFDR